MRKIEQLLLDLYNDPHDLKNPFLNETDIERVKNLIDENKNDFIFSSLKDGDIVYSTLSTITDTHNCIGQFTNMYDKCGTPIFTGDKVVVIGERYLGTYSIDDIKDEIENSTYSGCPSVIQELIVDSYDYYKCLSEYEREYYVYIPFIKNVTTVKQYPGCIWLEDDIMTHDYYPTTPFDVIVVERSYVPCNTKFTLSDLKLMLKCYYDTTSSKRSASVDSLTKDWYKYRDLESVPYPIHEDTLFLITSDGSVLFNRADSTKYQDDYTRYLISKCVL